MPVEPITDFAYVAGEGISEKMGEQLEKIPLWKKVRPYLLFGSILICILWYIASDFQVKI